jgi:hypothetical protein
MADTPTAGLAISEVAKAIEEKIQIGAMSETSRALKVESTRSTDTRMTNQKSTPEFGGKLTSAGLSNFMKVARASDCNAQ